MQKIIAVVRELEKSKGVISGLLHHEIPSIASLIIDENHLLAYKIHINIIMVVCFLLLLNEYINNMRKEDALFNLILTYICFERYHNQAHWTHRNSSNIASIY